jgi:hypothetical protein
MKPEFLKWSLIALLSATVITGCEKDKGEDNEEEVITTVELTFTPTGGGTALVFTFNDPDGPGGMAPTTDDIVLSANTTYNVSAAFRNDIAGEDITEEIEAEDDAHRIYYTVGAGSNITVSNLNNDGNGVPLGTTSTWTTGNAANGQVTVTLRHYGATPPNKEAADPVNSSKSSTDVEVVFATEVN